MKFAIDIPVRAAAEIAYSARFPYEERKNFESILSKFEDISESERNEKD